MFGVDFISPDPKYVEYNVFHRIKTTLEGRFIKVYTIHKYTPKNEFKNN
jgi:hypothetical protein